MKQENLQNNDIAEKARLEGLRIFPDNLEASELVRKNILGEINEEEEEKLLYFVQEKQYSPEVNELFKQSQEKNPAVSLIEVNHGAHIRVSPKGETKTIWTYGLGKCNATLTLTEMNDGARESVLTHFFPDKLQEHAGELSKLLSEMEKEKSKKTKTIIFSPGKADKNEKLEIEKPEIVEKLAMIVRSQLPNAKIEVIPYPEFHNRLSGTKDQGVLIAKITGQSPGEATYRTWFCEGNLS